MTDPWLYMYVEEREQDSCGYLHTPVDCVVGTSVPRIGERLVVNFKSWRVVDIVRNIPVAGSPVEISGRKEHVVVVVEPDVYRYSYKSESFA